MYILLVYIFLGMFAKTIKTINHFDKDGLEFKCPLTLYLYHEMVQNVFFSQLGQTIQQGSNIAFISQRKKKAWIKHKTHYKKLSSNLCVCV